jgi:hypothetical protein
MYRVEGAQRGVFGTEGKVMILRQSSEFVDGKVKTTGGEGIEL